jgi:hypothetical protein
VNIKESTSSGSRGTAADTMLPRQSVLTCWPVADRLAPFWHMCGDLNAWIFRKLSPLESKTVEEVQCNATQNTAINYGPVATKFGSFVTHAWSLRSVDFKQKPFNGRWVTAENIICSSSNVHIVTYQSRKKLNFCSVCSERARCTVPGISVEGKPRDRQIDALFFN